MFEELDNLGFWHFLDEFELIIEQFSSLFKISLEKVAWGRFNGERVQSRLLSAALSILIMELADFWKLAFEK